MKSNTISVFSGIGLLVLMMAGCSGSSDVAQNSNSNTNNNVAATGNNGGGRQVSNNEAGNVADNSMAKKTEPAKFEPAKTEPAKTETSSSVTPSESAGEAGRNAEPKSNGSADRSGSMLASKPPAEPAKKEPKRKKRVLDPPAEPTGESGTDPGDTLPQIEGKDVDGIEFSLSDYDGKVKMVDFWGDW